MKELFLPALQSAAAESRGITVDELQNEIELERHQQENFIVMETILKAQQRGLTLEQYEEAITQDAVTANVSKIAMLAYRHIDFQRALDDGLDDEKLAKQQPEFVSEIQLATKQLRAALGDHALSTLAADVLVILTHLFAYTCSYGGKDTRQEELISWHILLNYAKDNEAVKAIREISDQAYTEEQVVEYDQFRFNHHTYIANTLRTILNNYAFGSDSKDSELFKRDYLSACVYLYMLDENCEWTMWGIYFTMAAAVMYSFRPEDLDKGSLIKFAIKTVDEMIEKGGELREDIKRGKLPY